MEHLFAIAGKEHVVRIESISGNKYSAELDNKKINFEYVNLSENCFSIFIGEISYKVYFSESNEKLHIFVNGDHFNVEEVSGSYQNRQTVDVHKRISTESNVSAPMPGRILKILVSESQEIEVNQPLFIVESMKMENEVQSPIGGKVKSINFKENDLVSVGDTIIEIEQQKN